MESDDFNVADLADLGALLTADPSPLRSFSIDPAKVTALPGIWCRVDALRQENLHGLTLGVTLHLITTEGDWDRSLTKLAELWNSIKATLRPVDGVSSRGDSTLVGVTLPGSQTPLPAIAIPLDLTTTQESE